MFATQRKAICDMRPELCSRNFGGCISEVIKAIGIEVMRSESALDDQVDHDLELASVQFIRGVDE